MYNNEVEKVLELVNNSEEDLIKLIGVEKWNEKNYDGTFKPDFIGTGKFVWDSIKISIFNLICVADKGIPNDYVQDLIGGDRRDIIVWLLTALVTQYNIDLAIAVPVVSLTLKKGINNFCKLKIDN